MSNEDLYLIPSSQDQRIQRAAHKVLGEIYERAHRDDLPSITWSIATTGQLNGSVDQYIPAGVSRKIFESWVEALGLEATADPFRASVRRGELWITLSLPRDRGPWQE